jgi:hypothetical protein
MHKTYILSFAGSDLRTINYVEEILLKNRQLFLSYWNYQPYVFCVKSEESAQGLAEIFQFAPNFFIAEINVSNINGRLPKAAWEWFTASPYAKPSSPFSGGSGSPTSPFGSVDKT